MVRVRSASVVEKRRAPAPAPAPRKRVKHAVAPQPPVSSTPAATPTAAGAVAAAVAASAAAAAGAPADDETREYLFDAAAGQHAVVYGPNPERPWAAAAAASSEEIALIRPLASAFEPGARAPAGASDRCPGVRRRGLVRNDSAAGGAGADSDDEKRADASAPDSDGEKEAAASPAGVSTDAKSAVAGSTGWAAAVAHAAALLGELVELDRLTRSEPLVPLEEASEQPMQGTTPMDAVRKALEVAADPSSGEDALAEAEHLALREWYRLRRISELIGERAGVSRRAADVEAACRGEKAPLVAMERYAAESVRIAAFALHAHAAVEERLRYIGEQQRCIDAAADAAAAAGAATAATKAAPAPAG